MIKALSLAAAATLLGAGAAQAQIHLNPESETYQPQRPPPPPAYAYDSRGFTRYERPASKGFPLLGADAGITVLGVHIGGSAKIRIGADEELQHRRAVYVARSPGPPTAPPPVLRRDRQGYDAQPMRRRGYGDDAPPPCPHWDQQDHW